MEIILTYTPYPNTSVLWWERMRKNILSILQIPLEKYPISDIMLERKITINV